MSLKEDLTEDERSRLSVYDYPVSNRCSSVSASKGVHCNSTVNNFITPILHSKVMQNFGYITQVEKDVVHHAEVRPA